MARSTSSSPSRPLAVPLVLLFALVGRAAAALDVVPLPYAADKYAVIDAEVSTE